MSRYRSQLETLHQLRTRARDAQRARVADAMQAEAALDAKLMVIHQEAETGREMQRLARGDATIDPRAMLDMERYELLLKMEAGEIHKQKQIVQTELVQRRQVLAAAEQDLRVIEKLDERRREKFEQEERRREQRTMDEIATQQFLRKRANEAIHQS